MLFDFLTEVNIKIIAFWDVTSCNLVDRYRRFGESTASNCNADEFALNMKATCSSDMLSPIFQTTWRHIPEESYKM
jgi:hypothetical protein